MPQSLSIPFHPQIADGYCLAACAQMVLHYWGIQQDQADLAQQLGVRRDVGTPASHIRQLANPDLAVHYDSGDWETIQITLTQGVPLIAMVQAGELSHWQGESFQHALVVSGFDEVNVWLLDPAVSMTPIIASIDEFMLAWGEMDYRYAVVAPSGTMRDL